jgi:hypothetical protein
MSESVFESVAGRVPGGVACRGRLKDESAPVAARLVDRAAAPVAA